MFVLEVPALLVGGLWPLVVVMFVAGSATAPMLITSLSLAQKLVPEALVTEGMAVAVTGILIGISGGSAVAGWAIEAWGASPRTPCPVAAGALALLIILGRYRRLERAEAAGTGHASPPTPTPASTADATSPTDCAAPTRDSPQSPARWVDRKVGRSAGVSQVPARITATTSRSSPRWTRSARRPAADRPDVGEPEDAGRGRRRRLDGDVERHPGHRHGVAEGAVHRQGAAGDGAPSASRATPSRTCTAAGPRT